MKRTTVQIEEVAGRDHLAWAFWRAALGKRHRPEVQRYAEQLDKNLDHLQASLLEGRVALGRFHRFEIHDPKRRMIHAPVFPERVLHHALMAHLEPIFDRFLLDDTYACRPGKGSWAAVGRAQALSRRYPWFLKIDIRRYFASIDHDVLRGLIRRRIRGNRVLHLVDGVIDSFQTSEGRGLPIGALTSQHFANLYLAPLDRWVREQLRMPFVRYMDDGVLWGHDRSQLRSHLEEIRAFLRRELRLELKPTWQLQRTSRGLTFCGYRIFPSHLGLSARRKRRYRQARARWESAYRRGVLSSEELQAGYASVLAITQGADVVAWRRKELRLAGTVDA